MSKMLAKMNLISVVQQLKKEDIETIQGYVETIEQENQELKKQLEEYKKWYQNELDENSKLSQLWCDSRAKIAESENKQSEFIGWLEYVINNLDSEINQINGLSENLKREKERATIKYNVLIQIMKKYKEITGVKDE